MSTVAYSVGICYLSACTDEPNDEATAAVNAEHPTGIGPWKIADESFADGTPNGCPCQQDPTRRHLLFAC